jgi:hypothetical protein
MRRKSSKDPGKDTHQLDLKLEELTRKERELQELPKRIARERREIEMTIPPCPDIADRKRRKDHLEKIVTRGEVANAVREHNKSLVLLVLLAACTLSLIWWATRLMSGL